MDELESELRTLDREIARFVVEAFQREAPEALRAQLAAAMAEGVRPLQRGLEAIDGAVAQGAREAEAQAAVLRSDIVERARNAEEQAERRAFELQQALTRVQAQLDLARRDIQIAAGARAAAVPSADADPYAPEPGWWRRNGIWLAPVAAGVVVVAVVAAFFLVKPTGSAGLQPSPSAGSPTATAGGPPGATGAAAGPAQEGLARVLAQVSGSWSGERRKAALEVLCGSQGETAGCPDLQSRWLAGGRSRKEVDAALAVSVAALSEADGCAAPLVAGAPTAARKTTVAGNGDAEPLATLDCLLTEAGRAPRP